MLHLICVITLLAGVAADLTATDIAYRGLLQALNEERKNVAQLKEEVFDLKRLLTGSSQRTSSSKNHLDLIEELKQNILALRSGLRNEKLERRRSREDLIGLKEKAVEVLTQLEPNSRRRFDDLETQLDDVRTSSQVGINVMKTKLDDIRTITEDREESIVKQIVDVRSNAKTQNNVTSHEIAEIYKRLESIEKQPAGSGCKGDCAKDWSKLECLCYKVFGPLSYDAAVEFCQAANGEMATVKTLRAIREKITTPMVWAGVKRDIPEHPWTRADGTESNHIQTFGFRQYTPSCALAHFAGTSNLVFSRTDCQRPALFICQQIQGRI